MPHLTEQTQCERLPFGACPHSVGSLSGIVVFAGIAGKQTRPWFLLVNRAVKPLELLASFDRKSLIWIST